MKSHIILQVNVIFYDLYYNKQYHFLQKATTFLQKTANRREGGSTGLRRRAPFFFKKNNKLDEKKNQAPSLIGSNYNFRYWL